MSTVQFLEKSRNPGQTSALGGRDHLPSPVGLTERDRSRRQRVRKTEELGQREPNRCTATIIIKELFSAEVIIIIISLQYHNTSKPATHTYI